MLLCCRQQAWKKESGQRDDGTGTSPHLQMRSERCSLHLSCPLLGPQKGTRFLFRGKNPDMDQTNQNTKGPFTSNRVQRSKDLCQKNPWAKRSELPRIRWPPVSVVAEWVGLCWGVAEWWEGAGKILASYSTKACAWCCSDPTHMTSHFCIEALGRGMCPRHSSTWADISFNHRTDFKQVEVNSSYSLTTETSTRPVSRAAYSGITDICGKNCLERSTSKQLFTILSSLPQSSGYKSSQVDLVYF